MLAARSLVRRHGSITSSAARCLFSGAPDNARAPCLMSTRQEEGQDQQEQHDESLSAGERRRGLHLTKEQIRNLWDQLGWEKRGAYNSPHGGQRNGGRRRGRLHVDPDKFPLELFDDAPVVVSATSSNVSEVPLEDEYHEASAVDVQDMIPRNDSKSEVCTSPETLRRHAVEAEAEIETAIRNNLSSSPEDGKEVHVAYSNALNAWSQYQQSLVDLAKRQIVESRASAHSSSEGDGGPSSVVEMRSELRRTARQTSALLKRWEDNSIASGDGERGSISPPSVDAYRIVTDSWYAVHRHVIRYPDAAEGGCGGGESTTPMTGRYEAAEEATSVLRRMMKVLVAPSSSSLNTHGTLDVDYEASSPPSVTVGQSCDRVIRMWTDDVVGKHRRRRRRESARSDSMREEAEAVLAPACRASELLEELERWAANGGAFVPGVGGYNAVLFAYSRAVSELSHVAGQVGNGEMVLARVAAEEAEKVLIRMEEADAGRRSKFTPPRPISTSYRAVLMAWASLGTPAGAYRAEKVLRRAEEGGRGSSGDYAGADVASYRTVLNAFSKIAHLDGGQAAGKALEILARMEGEVGVLSLLRSLKESELADTGNTEQSLKAREPSSTHSKESNVRPDAACYSAALNAVARMRTATSSKIANGSTDRQERAPLAHGLLVRMEQALGRIEAPGLFDYGRVIIAWSRHEHDVNQAALFAETVLERMEGRIFDGHYSENSPVNFHDSLIASVTVWYNKTINLLAKSSVPDAAQRVEEIVMRMERMYHDYHSPPSVEANGLRCEQRIPNVPVVPDFWTYQLCIAAWADSVDIKDVTRAIRARELLNRMESMYLGNVHNMDGEQTPRNAGIRANALARPNVVCYNAAIKSCSSVSEGGEVGKRAALSIAAEIFEDLKKCTYDKPNTGTYGRMIQAYASLLLPGRERYESIEKVFQESCKQGQVSAFVLDMFQLGTTTAEVRKLVGHIPGRKKLKPSDLPLSWTKNTASASQ